MHNIPFIPGGIDNLSRDSRSISRDVSVLYNTDTSREIDRLSRDKLSMPPGMKGILYYASNLIYLR